MYIAFLVLMVLAIAVCCVAGMTDRQKLGGVGAALGLAAGIVLTIAVARTPSRSTGNPYFLGTFLILFCAGLPFGVGFNLGQAIKKKRQR